MERHPFRVSLYRSALSRRVEAPLWIAEGDNVESGVDSDDDSDDDDNDYIIIIIVSPFGNISSPSFMQMPVIHTPDDTGTKR